MEYKGLTLDKFQEDAIAAIESNHSVVVSAPTGSGKTLIADYIINRDVKRGIKVIYTAPIKALSNQKFKDFCREYGEENVGLLTGDMVINAVAPILVMTTEIYRNMVMVEDPMILDVSYVIFDEIHFINDIERGYVWEESVIFSKHNTRMLCLSATIPNADEFAAWIQAIKGHKVVVIKHDYRVVPLHVSFYDTELGLTTLEAIKDIADIPDYHYVKGRRHKRRPRVKEPNHIDLVREIRDKLPCIFFTFSRAGCQKKALELARKKMFKINTNIISFMRKKLRDAPKDINMLESTKILKHSLPFGIGFHHAGLLPVMKNLIEDLFAEGLIKVLYTTETFAVGINMPAKTVAFESLRKFDGRIFRFLNSKEYFQIAGRAGRRGIDHEGYVVPMIKRQDFDYAKIKNITDADTEPIKSQFKLGVNTVLNLIKHHGRERIDEILRKSFFSYQKYGSEYSKQKIHRSHSTFENIKHKLEKMEYLKEGKLTWKGDFGSKIYSDEIVTAEIFATDFFTQLNEYQALLLVACICYEPRERTQFYKVWPSKETAELRHLVKKHHYLSKEGRFNNIIKLTGLVKPMYDGASIFDIFDNTNLLEGDVIRFFRQMLDRVTQVKSATNERLLIGMMDNCGLVVNSCLKGIDVI